MILQASYNNVSAITHTTIDPGVTFEQSRHPYHSCGDSATLVVLHNSFTLLLVLVMAGNEVVLYWPNLVWWLLLLKPLLPFESPAGSFLLTPTLEPPYMLYPTTPNPVLGGSEAGEELGCPPSGGCKCCKCGGGTKNGL